MKKSMGIIGALIISLFFTGCADDTLPNEVTEKTGQSLESEAQGKGEVMPDLGIERKEVSFEDSNRIEELLSRMNDIADHRII